MICRRFRDGEGVACRFFRMNNTYLFIGEHKYWLMPDYKVIEAFNDEGDYVINRARLTRTGAISSSSQETPASPRTIRWSRQGEDKELREVRHA